MSRFLLVTDLDDTLVGDGPSLQGLCRRLADSASAHGSRIVYTTGRSLTLYRELAAAERLPSPDALVTSVGTEIYFDPDDGVADPVWAERLLHDWDRQQVFDEAARFADLVPQPATEQRPFKVSYFLTARAAAGVLPPLDAALRGRGLATRLVYSGDRHLDILPARGGKGRAMQFVGNRWGFEASRTVACGDSGNDITLFGIAGARGIIVGNARPELLRWYESNCADRLYLARAHYAAGILEGLRHFGFLGDDEA